MTSPPRAPALAPHMGVGVDFSPSPLFKPPFFLYNEMHACCGADRPSVKGKENDHARQDQGLFAHPPGDTARLPAGYPAKKPPLPAGHRSDDLRHGGVQHRPRAVHVALGAGHAQQPHLFRHVLRAFAGGGRLSRGQPLYARGEDSVAPAHTVRLRRFRLPLAHLPQRLRPHARPGWGSEHLYDGDAGAGGLHPDARAAERRLSRGRLRGLRPAGGGATWRAGRCST